MLLFLHSCTSSKTQFEKGNYEKAVNLSIKRLRKNPSSKKQKAILQSAYRYANSTGKRKVALLKQKQTLDKHDQIIAHYRGLQNIYANLLSCPGCLTQVTPVDYQIPLNEALQNGATAYADKGNKLFRSTNKEEARAAYRAWSKANRFIENTIDSPLLEEARQRGIINIAVTPIPVANQGLQLRSAFFQQQLVERLNGLSYRFAAFYAVTEDLGNTAAPDLLVELTFDDYSIGQTYVKETRETVTKDNVAIGEVKDSLGEKQTVYGTVEANVQQFEKTIESGGLLNLAIRSTQDNRILFQRKIPSTYVWINDWLTYQGDSRALSKKQRQLSKEKELIPPPPQLLFQLFTQPLFEEAARNLRREFAYLKE